MTVVTDGAAARRSGARASGQGPARARTVGEHPAHADGLKRLGDKPAVIEFASGGATIEVAARAGHRALVTRPMAVDVI